MASHLAQCQCGQMSARSGADPEFVVACNCKACQLRTGAPFGAALYFRKQDLTVEGGSKTWSRSAESGRSLTNHFCPECGTTLWWTLEMRPEHIGVAYGSFVTPVPDPVRAIWTDAKHGWVKFPEEWPTYRQGSPT